MNNQITVTYKLERISELQYSINSKPSNFTIDPEEIDFNLRTTIHLPPYYQGVFVILDISGIDKRNNEQLFSFTTENRFGILNYSDIVKAEKNRLSLPDNFLLEIFSLSIGAARGMLITKTSGTYLSNTILPIFNAIEILKGLKDVAAKLNTETSSSD